MEVLSDRVQADAPEYPGRTPQHTAPLALEPQKGAGSLAGQASKLAFANNYARNVAEMQRD